MIRYYPKNKITPNLYSDGSSLTLDGKPYYGYYYETYDKKFFSGANPEQGSNLALSPISQPSTKVSKQIVPGTNVSKQPQFIFDKILTVEEEVQSSFDFTNKFTPHYPKPTTSDYTKGYFVRYFSKSVGHNDSIVEISKNQFDSFKTNSNKQASLQYQVIDIFWQITGPLHTTGGYAGILDTNERLTNNKESEFAGLKNYIGGQYDKFSNPVTLPQSFEF